MNILITGAAGFIGSQLAHYLHMIGSHVVLLDDFSYGAEDNLVFTDVDFRTEVIHGDIRDQGKINELFENNQFDYVYHFAGIAPLPDCQTNPTNAISVNVGGFVNILEASRYHGVKKVIFASTSAIYENDVHFPSSELEFELPSLIYANTKYSAERFAQSYCTTYGMNVTCMRFANVYGPHIDCLRKQPPFIGYAIRELYFGNIPVFHSDGMQCRDYVYVDDLIDLAIKVQQGSGFDVVNVSANKNYSVRELYQIMSNLLGRSYEPEYTSENHYWSKYPELYTGKFPILTSVLSHEVNKFTMCNNAYAKEKYDWEPKIDIYEGLKRTIEYITELLSHQK